MSQSVIRMLSNYLTRSGQFFVNSYLIPKRQLTHSFILQKIASFEDVRTIEDQKNTLLIDVREPQELQETGVIPSSINIPLAEVESVLRDMPPAQFQSKYNKPKPDSSTNIIFSCKAGIRSANAQEIATKLGFTKTKNFKGGWLEWEEKIKK